MILVEKMPNVKPKDTDLSVGVLMDGQVIHTQNVTHVGLKLGISKTQI